MLSEEPEKTGVINCLSSGGRRESRIIVFPPCSRNKGTETGPAGVVCPWMRVRLSGVLSWSCTLEAAQCMGRLGASHGHAETQP